MSHITGKVYDLTQENMNKLIDELEAVKNENADLQGRVDGLLNAFEHMTKFNWPGSSAAEFASDALADFKKVGAE